VITSLWLITLSLSTTVPIVKVGHDDGIFKKVADNGSNMVKDWKLERLFFQVFNRGHWSQRSCKGAGGDVRPSIRLVEAIMQDEVVIHAYYG
jgi:hypothetical protein